VGETRIQLCGPLVARIGGERVDARLPGRQGRLLFAVLVSERRQPVSRAALVDALWGEAPPAATNSALSALLSKLRRVVAVEGRSDVRVVLPSEAWVDLEAAAEALHRAAGASAREDWPAVWGPARVAQHVLERPLLPGETAAWAVERRRVARASLVRALELAGLASARIGGSELDTAERAARRLLELEPLRESGTRLLMEVMATRGDRASALLAYDSLRMRLREELGVPPSVETQDLHRRLLA
jgi:SARP family transcriptional regulator, regulator of embCAB operon